MTAADPIRQALQRAYESHCADGYVVPDDETGPQEATGATESDESRVQAHGDGAGLREAVEALASRWLRLSGTAIDEEVREWTKAAGMTLLATLALHPAPTGDAPRDGEAAKRRTEGQSVIEQAIAIIRPILGPWYDGKAAQSAFALADAGLLADPTEAERAQRTYARSVGRLALEERLLRTLARAEKAGAEVAVKDEEIARLNERVRYWRDSECIGLRYQVRDIKAERDRARDTAAALEAEVARLSGQVGCAERLAVQYDAGMWPEWSVGDAIRAALSDTTGEFEKPGESR